MGNSALKEYGLVLVTAGSEAEAVAIASALVETQLAACVSIAPIQSVYRWQLTIKTNLVLFPDLEAQIKELHSYEVPEIIALPLIAGSSAYLDWLGKSIDN